MTDTPQSYGQIAAQENNGTGFASPLQQPYPSQQAMQAQREQAAAAQASAIDKANKARINWQPAAFTKITAKYAKKGK